MLHIVPHLTFMISSLPRGTIFKEWCCHFCALRHVMCFTVFGPQICFFIEEYSSYFSFKWLWKHASVLTKHQKMISPNIWVMGIFLLSISLIQSRSDQLSYRLHRTGTVGPINRPFPFSHAFIYRMVLLQRSHLWRSILLTEVVWLRSACQQEAQPFFQHRMWFLDMRV